MNRAGVAVLALALAGCGGDAADEELPGDYGQIIASEDDCSDLQDIFDTADQSDMDGRADVMEAADDRMREVGCYDD